MKELRVIFIQNEKESWAGLLSTLKILYKQWFHHGTMYWHNDRVKWLLVYIATSNAIHDQLMHEHLTHVGLYVHKI